MGETEAATQMLLLSTMDFLLQCILQHGLHTAALPPYVLEVPDEDVLDMQWSPGNLDLGLSWCHCSVLTFSDWL